MTEPELKTLLETEDEPDICSVCGYVYRVDLLKEGDDWNDFGYRYCPFCGHMTDPYA
jgi:rubredoxin